MSIVRTTNLTVRYGSRVGIESMNLEVSPGETFGFLGPNGAGKSTTIRLLMGLLKPTTGKAEIAGYNCWTQSTLAKQQVGYLPGDVRLYPWLSLRSAVPIVSKVRGMDIASLAGELAERFELEPTLPVRKMSRGTRQKLALVMAMAHQPRVLILDEPTAGLDPLMQAELGDQIRQGTQAGQTVLLSSHTLSEVESLCNRVAIIRKGHIIVDETLDALRQRAPRIVELEFADPKIAEEQTLPSFLKCIQRSGKLCICELAGPTPPLIDWVSQQPVVDIRIGKPDLERVFQSLYHQPGEATS